MKNFLAKSAAAFVLAAALGMSSVAQATDGWYGRVEAGYGFDGELDFDDLGELGFDDGWLADGALGYAWGGESSTGFRLEGEASYRSNDLEDVPSTEATALAGMLNGYIDFNRGGKWQPYIGAGVGYAKVELEDSGSSLDDSGVAYQGMAGVGIVLGPRTTLDIGYKYFRVNDLSLGEITLGDNDYDLEFDYVQQAATIGLRWQFAAPAAPVVAPPAPPPEPTPVVQVCPTNDFKVYFEWDRSNLNAEGEQTIADAAARAKACNVATVRVVGHTDTSGSKAYNIGLSNRRAAVVRDALVAAGISAASITTEGLGETQLDKATRDGVREPLNRRTAVTISFQ
jgi:outer membrane protein OmpA-like peptidoglycan-associated protein